MIYEEKQWKASVKVTGPLTSISSIKPLETTFENTNFNSIFMQTQSKITQPLLESLHIQDLSMQVLV